MPRYNRSLSTTSRTNTARPQTKPRLAGQAMERGHRSKFERFVLGNRSTGISATALLHHVRSTTPYWIYPSQRERPVDLRTLEPLTSGPELVEKSKGSMGWRNIINAASTLHATDIATEFERIDYFALCLAVHFATVASSVPSDVDSKIRGHCWDDPSEDVLEAQLTVVINALEWDMTQVSKKVVSVYDEFRKHHDLISGHHGELLGVLCGAWGAFLRIGNTKRANFIENIIHRELGREARLFKQLRLQDATPTIDTLLLKLSAILTHNVGDVDQGYSYWGQTVLKHTSKHQLFSRLAHQRGDRFGGEFIRAKAIYKQFISAEGHRNYPLREAKCLRNHPDLLLPLGPWYESWGRLVATHSALTEDDRAMVVRQLLRGCDSSSRTWCVPNQVGYYRALQGISSEICLEEIVAKLPEEYTRVLNAKPLTEHRHISENAFAAALGQRARIFLQSLKIG